MHRRLYGKQFWDVLYSETGKPRPTQLQIHFLLYNLDISKKSTLPEELWETRWHLAEAKRLLNQRMEFLGSVCCLWFGFVQVALLGVAVRGMGIKTRPKWSRMRGEGTETLVLSREWKLLSAHPMGKGTGTAPGDTKIAIFSEGVCVCLALREEDTPGSAESLLINHFLLLQWFCPL